MQAWLDCVAKPADFALPEIFEPARVRAGKLPYMMRRNSNIDIAISDGYHRVMQISVAEAKNKLPELIKAVENGEAVTISRRGVPVVDIVRTKEPTRKKPKFGTLKGKIKIVDPDWWKPMTDEEVDDFVEGRH